jgi:hypothetical protein
LYELHKERTDFIGTVRKNRAQLPSSVLKKKKFGRKLARRRVKKYYKNIFFHLLDTALINSYIYFKKIPIEGNSKVTHSKFRVMLAEQLTRNCAPITAQQTETENDLENEAEPTEEAPMEKLHLSVYSNALKRCFHCFNSPEKKSNKTHWFCDSCDKFFCQMNNRNCFKDYHETNDVILGLRKRIRRSTRRNPN